jgi:hypothetical protein
MLLMKSGLTKWRLVTNDTSHQYIIFRKCKFVSFLHLFNLVIEPLISTIVCWSTCTLSLFSHIFSSKYQYILELDQFSLSLYHYHPKLGLANTMV